VDCRTKISVGFGFTLAIFLVVGIVAYRSVTQQTEAADWVAHTREVQNQLTQVLSNLQDAETGQRGYLITGVDGYLAPTRTASPGSKRIARAFFDSSLTIPCRRTAQTPSRR